jgi:adenylosuccinate lyase
MQKDASDLLNSGKAITPLDGRNYFKIKELSNYFSEIALYKYRILIEIKYLEHLAKLKIITLKTKDTQSINRLYTGFNEDEYLVIKKIESIINHDVKAVEYYLKEKLIKIGLKEIVSYIHFGLTSEDTNNLAYGLALKEFNENYLQKNLLQLINQLKWMGKKNKSMAVLARTHGQPAVGTTIGKEIINFYYRLEKQYKKIVDFKFEGKCNGAVGNNNALKVALPKMKWMKENARFVDSLGLESNQFTTQILFYDNWIEFFQMVSIVNGILNDLCINIWLYISNNIFIQKKKNQEVGSSTMPQKINPINFENAEGNLQLANSLFEFFQRKLLHSRLQRDLSDSTIRRNFGEAFGYTILAWKNISTGLEKLSIDQSILNNELNQHWEILTEAIQTVLRLKKDDAAYEKLKSLSRGRTMNSQDYKDILKSLGLEKDKRLIDLTPEKYIGYASDLSNI